MLQSQTASQSAHFASFPASSFSNEKHSSLHGYLRRHATKKKSGRGKTKTMKGQVIFFLFYAELMKCFNSIITVNWVVACKSSGLHNYTLIVLYTSCHETDSRQASTIRATDTDKHGLWKLVFRIHQPVPMYSGDSVEDEGSVQPLSL